MTGSIHIPAWLTLLPAVVFFGYLIERNIAAFRKRPKIAKEDIVYQEYFASVNSQKNILTKLGGGRNCPRLVVTRDLLWVTSWFPFSLIAPVYDGVHVIPLPSITSVQFSRCFGKDTLLLSYVDAGGRTHTLRLIPKNRERFLAAIGAKPDLARLERLIRRRLLDPVNPNPGVQIDHGAALLFEQQLAVAQQLFVELPGGFELRGFARILSPQVREEEAPVTLLGDDDVGDALRA